MQALFLCPDKVPLIFSLWTGYTLSNEILGGT